MERAVRPCLPITFSGVLRSNAEPQDGIRVVLHGSNHNALESSTNARAICLVITAQFLLTSACLKFAVRQRIVMQLPFDNRNGSSFLSLGYLFTLPAWRSVCRHWQVISDMAFALAHVSLQYRFPAGHAQLQAGCKHFDAAYIKAPFARHASLSGAFHGSGSSKSLPTTKERLSLGKRIRGRTNRILRWKRRSLYSFAHSDRYSGNLTLVSLRDV